MKPITITALFVCISLANLYSQDLINNFKLDENKLIYWQSVIETDLSIEQLNCLIMESGHFIQIERFEDKTICVLKPFKANYQAYGYSTMKAPFYISRTLIEGNVIFEFRENRYRVTVKNIVFRQNTPDIFSAQNEVETFESWVLNKNQELKPAFFKDGSDILNNEFMLKTKLVNIQSEAW